MKQFKLPFFLFVASGLISLAGCEVTPLPGERIYYTPGPYYDPVIYGAPDYYGPFVDVDLYRGGYYREDHHERGRRKR